MHIRTCLRSTLAAAGLALAGAPHLALGQETRAEFLRMRQASEAEQIAWITSHLRAGMPPSEIFGDLILNRSAITLPVIEQKIEEILRSPAPARCFTDKSVDPQNFVGRAAYAITEPGNVQSLKESSKLIKIDERRFGWMVESALIAAGSYGNSFTLAYRGFELGDPALDSRITAWVQGEFAERDPPPPVPGMAEGAEAVRLGRLGWLADAMVERYGAVPTETQWLADPIVSRFEPVRALVLHDDVMRAASDTLRRRTKR